MDNYKHRFACGFGAQQAAQRRGEMAKYAMMYDHISKPRKRDYMFGGIGLSQYDQQFEDIYQFDKDSLHFIVVKHVSPFPEYFLVTSNYNTRNRNNKTIYHAVVDENLNYICPPDAAYAVDYMDLKKKLTIVNKDSLYSFLDSSGRLIFPFQPYNIVSAFKPGNEWYATGTMDTIDKTMQQIEMDKRYVCQHTRVYDPRTDTVIKMIDRRRDEATLHKVLLKNGVVVSALQDYYIIKLLPAEFSKDKPCFVVQNRKGKEGILDIDGKVIMPEVSFCYDQMMPVNKKLLLVKDTTDKYYKLVTPNHVELMPGEPISTMTPVSRPDQLLNSRQQLPPDDLYKAEFPEESGKGFFYVNGRGRIFADFREHQHLD